MTTVKTLTCVICPNSCSIAVSQEKGSIISIDGSKCKRGDTYAAAECLNPVRTLTSTVRLAGAGKQLLPVKSSKPLPKGLISECMKVVNNANRQAPVEAGDIIIENILGTGADIIATARIS